MVGMSTHDAAKHPRNQDLGHPGHPTQFGVKQQTAPTDTIGEASYFMVETEGQGEHVFHAADADAAMRAYLAAADLTVEGSYPLRVVREGDENPGLTIVENMYGDVKTLEELRHTHSSLDGWETRIDPLLDFSDVADGDVLDLDGVREALTASPGDGPYMVDAAIDSNNSSVVNVSVFLKENLLWDDMFTEEELNEHHEIVDDVYSEWFGVTDLDGDEWENVDVNLQIQVPLAEASQRIIAARAWGAYAKFRNETDPGTFGSPYVGHEIRKRIDAAIAQKEEAEQHARFEQQILEHGR